MKQIRIAILLLLIPLCCVAFAALSKTSTIVELDAWQGVSSASLVVGTAGDISGSYETIIYLEIAYTEDAKAQSGVEVIIEVSYGDDNWTLITGTPFTTPSATAPTATTLDGAVTAGETSIELVSAAGVNTNGQKWFILDDTAANSESVRTSSVNTNTVTICHDAIRNHDTGLVVFLTVHEYVLSIPTAFAFVRVLINNTDGDAQVHFTTRLSKVTSL